MAQARTRISPARIFARPAAGDVWLGPQQRAVLSRLGTARPAALLLTGPPSCGKSTLLSYLATQAATDSVVLRCRGPKRGAAAVLAELLTAAELGPWGLSEIEQRNLLTVFVQQRRSQGRSVVLALDDAHGFDAAAWQEVERLRAFEAAKRPAIEVLAAGLAPIWHGTEVSALPPPLVLDMPAPTHGELVNYLDWRLARYELAGLLTPGAKRHVARSSQGRFRAADVLGQLSILLGRRLAHERIDAAIVKRAVATLASRRDNTEAVDTAAVAAPPEAAPKTKAPVADDMAPPLPPAALLVSLDGKLLDRVALGARTLLGRSEHNDVPLPSPYLSRHHAVIVGTPEGYYVVDLNSLNGLMLNGRPVDRAVLCDQDVLTIGSFRIKVELPTRQAAPGDPWPEAESLADTAVLPTPPAPQPTPMRRIK